MSRIALLALAASLVAGCSKAPPPPPVDESMIELSQKNAEFAVELYQKLREKPGNMIFSPYSISAALAMTYDGARNNTAAEMAKVLHFPADRNQLHAPFDKLHRHLVHKSPGFELSIANALWGQQGMEFEPEFRKNTADYYGAGLKFVDFVSDTERARRTINDWTAAETRGKIPELLNQGDVTEFTRLVLTNAIYQKAAWATPFDEAGTRPAEFHCSETQKVEVPMMSQRRTEYPYLAASDFEILEIPYQGNRASFVVILPRKGIPLERIESTLTVKTIADFLVGLKSTKIDEVSLPRLKIKQHALLKEALLEMGIRDAFADRVADFSGMTPIAWLYIAKVIHEATLDVDEKGVIAAGATAVVMHVASAPLNPLHFNANRPFVFLIRDRETGSILFMGRVTDPSVK